MSQLDIHTDAAKVLQDVIRYARKMNIEIKSVFMPPYKEGMLLGVRLERQSVQKSGITQEEFRKQKWGAGMIIRYEDITPTSTTIIEADVVSVNFDDETIGVEISGYKNEETQDILFLPARKCVIIQDFVKKDSVDSIEKPTKGSNPRPDILGDTLNIPKRYLCGKEYITTTQPCDKCVEIVDSVGV